MLVLTRKINESIVFPTLGITVRVVAVRGGGVRLGIEAPSDVPVLREELLKTYLDSPSVITGPLVTV